ncbi:MAG: DMT family transporter [Sphingomonadaceae bacterium]
MSEAPPHALLAPRVAIPFIIISLIWGSTWLVIVDQIDGVPPQWSVVWRFALATVGAAILAKAMGHSLAISRRAHALAAVIGLCQFCGNFNFVYPAELHLTSGIVAVMLSMMFIPNAIFGKLFLGQPITPRFMLGGLIAIAGIALLLVNESREARLGGNVPLGVWLALGAVLAASLASVFQAGKTGQSIPMPSLLAWSIFYGLLFDIALALMIAGPPVFPARWSYWAGVAYLGVFGSLVTFPLYWRLVREIGAGRAAYNGIAVVVIAMLLSTVFEGYRWSPLAVSGAVLSLAGLVVALRARNPALKSG